MRNGCVVYITDENYAMPTCISILSLLKNLRGKGKTSVYVFADDISDESKGSFQELGGDSADIIIKSIDGRKYKEIPQSFMGKGIHVSLSALFKFEIANALPQIDTALYLDGDVLINNSIDEIFEMELGDSYVASVDDMGDSFGFNGESFLAARIGLREQKYFNSGVMLLNLKKMREDAIALRLRQYRQQGINYFMDQDAFNYVLGERRIELPYKYNFRTPLFDNMSFWDINERFFMGRYDTIRECIEDQSILHMSDKMKPWKYNIPWFTEYFLQYYNISPYKDTELALESPLKPLRDEIRSLQDVYALAQYKKEHKIWRFPKERIPRDCRLVLYGAGEVGKDYFYQMADSKYCDIVLWVDRNYLQIKGVNAPELIRKVDFDYILIAIEKAPYVKDVKKGLEEMGISPEKIIESF